MSKTILRIWNTITTILVVLVVIMAILLVGVRLVGFQVYTVLSGSMEPTYHTGSLIYVKKVDYHDIQAGDPITFMLDEDTVATHRVVRVVPDEDDPTVIRFATKGDANENEDGRLVHYKNVIGEPKFSIPGLGYVANYIQNPPGKYVAMCGGAILLLLVFIPDIFASDEDDKKKEKKSKKGRKAIAAAPEAAEAPQEEIPEAPLTEELQAPEVPEAPRAEKPKKAVHLGRKHGKFEKGREPRLEPYTAAEEEAE